jgi:cytidylate kinase
MHYSIAIDGPAGAGKSTIAKKIAGELGFIYVDTGVLYRTIALYLLRKGIDGHDAATIEAECSDINVTLGYNDQGEQQVYLNGENVTAFIRTEEVGNMASVTSAIPAVRAALLDLQRGLAREEDVLMDGRDIGTHVLPDAFLKIYLTASSAVRARRRYDQLVMKGETCDLADIERDIIQRDKQDMSREIAPLRQAKDALLVDTSDMTIQEVVDTIIAAFNKKKQEAGVL